MSSSRPARSEADLTPVERERLENAYRELREAVGRYEPFLGREIGLSEPVPEHRADDVARAQADIERAEQRLWLLREALLGWARPSWAPDAALVADWFSEEDRSYDDLTAEAGQ
jgi:hypothetical protein